MLLPLLKLGRKVASLANVSAFVDLVREREEYACFGVLDGIGPLVFYLVIGISTMFCF